MCLFWQSLLASPNEVYTIYHVQSEFLAEENLDEFGTSQVVCQILVILPSKLMLMSHEIYKKSEQAGFH